MIELRRSPNAIFRAFRDSSLSQRRNSYPVSKPLYKNAYNWIPICNVSFSYFISPFVKRPQSARADRPGAGASALHPEPGWEPFGTGMVFRTSSVDVSCNGDPAIPHLVVAVPGSPALPRDGAWSLARQGASDPAPIALDPAFPLPLIRPNAMASSDRWCKPGLRRYRSSVTQQP